MAHDLLVLALLLLSLALIPLLARRMHPLLAAAPAIVVYVPDPAAAWRPPTALALWLSGGSLVAGCCLLLLASALWLALLRD